MLIPVGLLLAGGLLYWSNGRSVSAPGQKSGPESARAKQPLQSGTSESAQKTPKPEVKVAAATQEGNAEKVLLSLNHERYGKDGFLNNYSRYKDLANLPERIRAIAGLSGEKYMERMAALDALGKKLTPDEIAAIYAYIAWGKNDEDAYALKNDLLNELRKQTTLPEGLVDVMLDLLYNESQDRTMRLYSLQHLRDCFDVYEKPRERQLIADAYYDFVKEKNSALSGTALLALVALSEDHPSVFERSKAKEASASLAFDESADRISRISAIQTCAIMGMKESLPEIRALVSDSKDSNLRLSAIAALGQLGDGSDIAILDKIAEEKESFHEKAIKVAMSKITARTSNK